MFEQISTLIDIQILEQDKAIYLLLGASVLMALLIYKLKNCLKQEDDAMTLEELFDGKLYKGKSENQELFQMLDKKGPYPKSMDKQGQITLQALINLKSVITYFTQK